MLISNYPVVWMWAFYRIDKLGKGLALILGIPRANPIAKLVRYLIG